MIAFNGRNQAFKVKTVYTQDLKSLTGKATYYSETNKKKNGGKKEVNLRWKDRQRDRIPGV